MPLVSMDGYICNSMYGRAGGSGYRYAYTGYNGNGYGRAPSPYRHQYTRDRILPNARAHVYTACLYGKRGLFLSWRMPERLRYGLCHTHSRQPGASPYDLGRIGNMAGTGMARRN
ncbi:MAG TPA: hypothetical protein PLD25_23760 [Chloroflexota bacterium]|nr:hypothetical protein [Chloroflexota bacterium]HUM70391.1 hypothetical protein [Chloroflexota bacterium]